MNANGHEAPTALSLFSGIGGLDRGLSLAGFRHVGFCESDDWRRSVLAARWPGVPIWDDVREVAQGIGGGGGHLATDGARTNAQCDGPPLSIEPSSPDLLCGGFPCQDVSVAGQRRGLAGARSGLFHEFARIAESLRPRWLLVENVPGLLSSNGGRDFGVVLGTLADLGYGVAWRIVDSRFFGVPQRRRRVFVVGTLAVGDPRAAAERSGEILAVGASCERHPPTGREAGAHTSVASLSGLGNGGPDDNDGQAGRLVTSALKASAGRSGASSYEPGDYVAGTVRSHPRPGSNSDGNIVSLALNAKRGKRDDGESETFVVAATLSSGGHPNSNMPGRRKEDDVNLVTAFHQIQDPITGAEFSPALGGKSGGMGDSHAATVRRLTPTECERLQALPDGWTNPDGKAPDSRRYAGLGDAVTASVGRWLGERLIRHA